MMSAQTVFCRTVKEEKGTRHGNSIKKSIVFKNNEIGKAL